MKIIKGRRNTFTAFIDNIARTGGPERFNPVLFGVDCLSFSARPTPSRRTGTPWLLLVGLPHLAQDAVARRVRLSAWNYAQQLIDSLVVLR